MPESVAIVTGASSGIGEATALRLARDFSALTLVAREGLQPVTAKVREAGKRALTVELDLKSPKAASEVVARTLAEFGQIDALVNIAGAVAATDLFQMTDEQWDDGLALKFHGARRLTLKAWDALKSTKGAVVFISGNAATVPRAAAAAVGAINAAIEALAKAFADRGLEDGVQVNSISPGAILTPRRLAMLEAAAASKHVSLEEAKRAFLGRAGISRFGTAEDIAELIAFAVSRPARWMTGSLLRMDGGEVRSV
jgi:3-oxoacyl-[acyl-carrier protein] reductase